MARAPRAGPTPSGATFARDTTLAKRREVTTASTWPSRGTADEPPRARDRRRSLNPVNARRGPRAGRDHPEDGRELAGQGGRSRRARADARHQLRCSRARSVDREHRLRDDWQEPECYAGADRAARWCADPEVRVV